MIAYASVVTISHWLRSVGFGLVLEKNRSFDLVWFSFLTNPEALSDVQ